MKAKLTASLLAAPVVGRTPVALPPKYQDPISVKRPLPSNMAPFGPMLLTSLRKAPKYEYLVVKFRRSKYSADVLKKYWVSLRAELSSAYSVIQIGLPGYLGLLEQHNGTKRERKHTQQSSDPNGLPIPRNCHTNVPERNRPCSLCPELRMHQRMQSTT